VSKKRILILGSCLDRDGGVSNFANLLLEGLTKYKYCVEYFATGKRSHFFYEIFFLFYFLRDVVAFIRTLYSFKPHLIHINPSLNYKSLTRDSIYLFLAKQLRFKVIFFIHGWHEGVYKYFKRKNLLVRIWLKKVFNLPDRVIVLAESFRKQLIDFGIKSSMIEVLTIMIDYKKYFQYREKKSKRKIYILFLSKFVRDKGVYEVVKAIPVVLKKHTNGKVNFILAGSGPEVSSLKSLTEKFGVTEHAKFVGQVRGQKKINIFQDADVFVFPSHHEGFPTVIAEAMAAGLSVISTGVGAIPEIIENGVNGLLLDKPDENELAMAILDLINNPELMTRMSKNNINKAKNYDVSVVCARLAQVYNEL